MIILLGIFTGLFLAWANGANDNFKGVATLVGSGTVSYRKGIIWATSATALGSLAALVLAQELLHAFTGKGLVDPALLASAAFPLSVALAAAATVMLATLLGFPVSTTHALIGALMGAGWFGSDAPLNLERLQSGFLVPLLLSPLIAIGATVILYKLFRLARKLSGIRSETCICIGNEVIDVLPDGIDGSHALAQARTIRPSLSIAPQAVCRERYQGQLLGLTVDRTVNSLHYLSSGMVSFARGLNDTPKIAAILLAGAAVSPQFAIAAVATFMAAGGLIQSRRVADTLANKITGMNHGQGLTANLITSAVVIFASKLGLPVSTTHVSSGALFGIGAVNGRARWRVIVRIIMAWLITLPLAAALGSVILILR